MFYKKHPIATAIVLALLMKGLLVVAYGVAAIAGFALLIYLVATDPGDFSLFLIATAACLVCFVALFKPLLLRSQRRCR